MKHPILALAAIAALAACTPQQTEQVNQTLLVACSINGIVQPIAVAVTKAAVPGSAPVLSADEALVHPAVVAACAKLGGAATAAAVQGPTPQGPVKPQ